MYTAKSDVPPNIYGKYFLAETTAFANFAHVKILYKHLNNNIQRVFRNCCTVLDAQQVFPDK